MHKDLLCLFSFIIQEHSTPYLLQKILLLFPYSYYQLLQHPFKASEAVLLDNIRKN